MLHPFRDFDHRFLAVTANQESVDVIADRVTFVRFVVLVLATPANVAFGFQRLFGEIPAAVAVIFLHRSFLMVDCPHALLSGVGAQMLQFFGEPVVFLMHLANT